MSHSEKKKLQSDKSLAIQLCRHTVDPLFQVKIVYISILYVLN